VFTLGCIERDANDCWQVRPIDDDVVKAKVRALAPVITADTCRVDRILVAGAGNRRAAEDALRAMGLLAEQKDAPGIDVADVLAPADSPLSH